MFFVQVHFLDYNRLLIGKLNICVLTSAKSPFHFLGATNLDEKTILKCQ